MKILGSGDSVGEADWLLVATSWIFDRPHESTVTEASQTLVEFDINNSEE